MRIGATAVTVALALCAPAAVSAASGDKPATAVLSTRKTGATHVKMTVAFRSELQCGRLMGSRTLTLTLPAKARVAPAIPAAAITVSGRAASAVAVAGRVVTVTLPLPHGMLCDSITLGTVRVVVTPAAGFANPKAPGTYTVRIAHGGETFAAPLKIHA